MRSARRTLITAGPTVTAAEILQLLPAAELRPPVAADQVLRWDLRTGDRLLIIDGLFLQSRAVRHKELLALIAQGVEVYGAASMGALRAAELADFGMTGIGSVFRAYRDQRIVGDDEVALLHADADAGHRPLSWALVDLKYAVAHAHRSGVISHATAERIINAAAHLPFTSRDSFTILTSAQEDGADRHELDVFRAQYSRSGPRIKRRDALTALRWLSLSSSAAPGSFPAPPVQEQGRLRYRGTPVPLAETVYLRSWRTTPLPKSCRASGPGSPAPAGCEDVVTAMALTWPGYPDALRSVAAAHMLASHSAADSRSPLAPGVGWPALSAELSARLEELGLPSDPNASRAYEELLRGRERELPWAERGPLLATRLWRTTALLDWATPVVAALRDHPAFAATAAAVSAAGLTDGPYPSATEENETRAQCRRLLAEWEVADRTDLLPALRERGFLDTGDFVRTVRAHLRLLTQ